jgi:DNA repair protein RecN (Recombination protein N)
LLSQLHIQNVAVIENVSMELRPGFNVLTGETGAGKSILIDSIHAVLGGRTRRDLIRTGTDKASVSAVFSGLSEKDAEAVRALGYEPDENGELLVSREIFADGRSVCKINLSPATAAVLKALSAVLIDIHGQHDSQMLSDPELHMLYIDAYGNTEELRNAYREAYEALKAVEREIKKLSVNDAEKAQRIDLLSYQVREIEGAAVAEGEEEELLAQKKRMDSTERLSGLIAEAVEAFDGTDDAEGLLTRMETVIGDAAGLSEYFPDFSGAPEKFRGMYYEFEELASEIRACADELEFDPALQNRIEARLDAIYRLKRKYGGTVEAMLAYYEKAKQELDSIEFSEEKLAELQKQEKILRAKASELAGRLTDARKKAAARFEQNVAAELSYLDMPNSRFEVRFEKSELSPDGQDVLEFYISTNAGEPLKPLVKIASGGELSRIMLSIKNVLAENDRIDTLIFDEVDTGISGSAAEKVGRKLKQVSKGRQIVCVTHLAQVAAYADNHLYISKSTENGRTYTNVEELDRPGRIEALARIMGGANVTDSIRRSAEELLRLSGN